MSFLRLGALWALPLVLLPILIHLLHRRRHPSAPWAAMMFLQRAAQTRRRGAKLRRWLILITRTLVVAAVLLALARPLSSGAFGVAASRVGSASPTIVLLDRSPSMQRRIDGGETRQISGLRSIVATLKTLGAGPIVVFDSASIRPVQVGSADALLEPVFASGADSSADVPRRLRDVLAQLRQSDQNVADVWVCSDLQQNDWRTDSPLWKQVEALASDLGAGVRYHLLRFPVDRQDNTSVSVTRVRWLESDVDRQLAVSIKVLRDDSASTVVPVSITIGGVTSVVNVKVVDGVGQVSDHRLNRSIAEQDVYGKVSIPADVNAADDQWFFTVSGDQNRRVGLVTDESCLALEVASDVLGHRVFSYVNGSKVGAGQGGRLEASSPLPASQSLSEVAIVVWQGTLPSGQDAKRVTRFLEQGGSAIFFPAQTGEQNNEFHGVRWGQWKRGEIQLATFDEWEYQISSHCSIVGETVRLSSTRGNELLAGNVRVGRGTAWFCGADVIDSDSLFVKNGLVLYGLLSEAMDASVPGDGGDNGFVAGRIDGGWADSVVAGSASSRFLLSRSDPIGLAEFGHHSGVLMITPSGQSPVDQSQGQVVAINRAADETSQQQLEMSQLVDLAPAIDWNQVSLANEGPESERGFVREIWGVVWVMVIAGMLCEAWLSLPARARRTTP